MTSPFTIIFKIIKNLKQKVKNVIKSWANKIRKMSLKELIWNKNIWIFSMFFQECGNKTVTKIMIYVSYIAIYVHKWYIIL